MGAMRTLSDRLRERAKAEADDRDLTSRSDLRREQQVRETALKRLATTLVNLKPKQLERLALDEPLLEAIALARSMPTALALNRQIGVVRQHLRERGDGWRELASRVAELEAGTLASTPPTAPAEAEASPEVTSWIERLTSEGDAGLAAFLELHPEADRQALRQAARAAMKARESGLPLRSIKKADERLRRSLEAWL